MPFDDASMEQELAGLRDQLDQARAERDGFRRLAAEKDDRLRYLEQLVDVFKEERREMTSKTARLRELLRRTLQERDTAVKRLKDVARLLPASADPRRHPREDGPQPTIEAPPTTPRRVEIRPLGVDERLVEEHWKLLCPIVEDRSPEELDLADLEALAGELIADMNPDCLTVRVFPFEGSGRTRPALHLLNAARVAMFIARRMGYDEPNLRCLGICAMFAGQPGSRWLVPENTHDYARVIRTAFFLERLMSPDRKEDAVRPEEALRRAIERAHAGDLDSNAVRALLSAVGGPKPGEPAGTAVPAAARTAR